MKSLLSVFFSLLIFPGALAAPILSTIIPTVEQLVVAGRSDLEPTSLA